MDKQRNNELVQIAVDAYYNRPSDNPNYSRSKDMEVIRKALIEMNGGSENFGIYEMEAAKTNGIYQLISETVTRVVNEGLVLTHPIFQFVDFRNVANGDQNSFIINDEGEFVVSTITHGTQQLRRQRLTGGEEITVKTELHGIKIYEELRRVMAGRVDFVKMIEKVIEAFQKDIANLCYNVTITAFEGIAAPYKVSGTYTEDNLLNIIDHVEANTGKKAFVMGSKQAVRKITVNGYGADSNLAKDDKYKMGYYGQIASTPIIALENAHKVGTTDFILGNDLYIIAGEDKFIKFVTEGETFILNGEPQYNQALQYEYLMFQNYGAAAVFTQQAGIYKIS